MTIRHPLADTPVNQLCNSEFQPPIPLFMSKRSASELTNSIAMQGGGGGRAGLLVTWLRPCKEFTTYLASGTQFASTYGRVL